MPNEDWILIKTLGLIAYVVVEIRHMPWEWLLFLGFVCLAIIAWHQNIFHFATITNRHIVTQRDGATDRTTDRTMTIPARFIYENHVTAEKTKGTKCPILMSPLQTCTSVTVSTTCGHIFDTGAFATWNNTHKKCPVCRVPVESTYILYSS